MTTWIRIAFSLVLTVLTTVNAQSPTRDDATALQGGLGLAAAFPADRGIESHHAVRFAEQFEAPEFADRWDEMRNRDDRVLTLVPAADSVGGLLGERALRVRADLQHNTGGGLTKWFESSERVFVRFYVRFAADCGHPHHLCTLRANKSLSGRDRWSGFGGAGERPSGDQRFSTALEPSPHPGKPTAPGSWNFYSYWHEMEQSGDGKFWGNSFRPADRSETPRDQWICCELMLRHNTPGKRDGEQSFWIDGELRGHFTGINWRTTETLQANAFTLEAYVTDRWTEQRFNEVLFDNVVIAHEYIGPSVAPLPELPIVFREDFEDGHARWETTDATAWRIAARSDGHAFGLSKRRSHYKPPVRSPLNIALVRDVELSDFVLTFDVRSTKDTGNHRDCCVFFAHQDSQNFYYAHLGARPDPASGQIMLVQNAPRRPLTRNRRRVPWDDEWHTVKVERDSATGRIAVYFDDMTTPQMAVVDRTFSRGRIGLGSFDDMNDFDNVVLRGR